MEIRPVRCVWNRKRFSRQVGFSPAMCILVLCLGAVPVCVSAQEPDNLSTPEELKRLSMEELLDIEVFSVSRRPEKLTETPSAIQVITQDDIRYSGATSVPELLRLASNLQVAQVNASQWAISARGFNNVLANKLLVLIDGRVVYTPMYAGVFWDVQNLILEDIDRIEVISGPGGTLWGANAVNGVINIVTKSSKDTGGLFVEAGLGTELRGLGSVRYGGNIGSKLTYRVYGTAFKRHATIYPDSVDAADGWTMAQTGLRFDWDLSEKDAITFQSNHYDDRPDPDGGMPVLARGTNVLARWTRLNSQRSNFQWQAYFDQTWRDFRKGFSEELRTYDIESQHRFGIGDRHEIIYGLGFRFMDHRVNNLELFAFLPARKSLSLYNVFIQDEWELIKASLRLSAGLKVEHNTYTKFQLQPNLRLTWLTGRHQTVWGSVSRAVRNPARIDREFFLYLAPDLPFIVGSDAKSEEVVAYEVGWRLQSREALSISLSTFYNTYDNIRSVEPGPPPFNIPVTFGNGVKGNTYGVELSATYQMNSWCRLRGGYTFLRKDLVVKTNSADSNNGSAESNDPAHQVLIQPMINVPGKFEFGAVLRYVAMLPQPYVSEYVGLDMRVGWRLAKLVELNVVGQNLLYDAHMEFIPSSPAPKEIQRGIYTKLVVRL